MSLWLHRRAITRAVAGELSSARDARLRRHLAGCATCRQHYDAASLVAGDSGVRARARERARLQEALGQPRSAQLRARPWKVAALASGALLPVAAALLITLRPARVPEAEVTERGAAEAQALLAEAARASLVLRFYARRVGRGQNEGDKPGEGQGPVRLVGEMPGSGELRVERDEEVQVAYTGLAEPRHLHLVARDGQGRTTALYPRGREADGALAPTEEARLLGAPFSPGELGTKLQLTATVARAPGDRAPAVLTAVLQVGP